MARVARRIGGVVAVLALTLSSAAAASSDAGFSVRWAETMSGPSSEDEFDGIAAAPDRSAYVTGKFEREATIGGESLTSAGAADIPLARFDAEGRPLWVERFGGPGEDNFFDIDANTRGAVATGWFAGTVEFGSVTITSSGPSDCVVAAFRPDGTTRWARAFGGPGRDGCNEVTITDDGRVTTSMDTEGGWIPTDAGPIPRVRAADTVLLRLAPDGSPRWMRPIGGDGTQRGKALAVAPDGSVSFGGDTVGALTIGDEIVDRPASGGGRDAFLSRWSPDGTLEWVEFWGGPGDDLAKGVVDDGRSVSYVGTFTGSITVGTTALDAGVGVGNLVARRAASGRVRWATAVSADVDVGGTELASAPDGGIVFGSQRVPGLRFGSTSGPGIALDESNGGTAWLVHYRPDGTPAFARTIAGTAGPVGEIARVGSRVYVDVVLRGAENTIDGIPIRAMAKDASVWAIDLQSTRPSS